MINFTVISSNDLSENQKPIILIRDYSLATILRFMNEIKVPAFKKGQCARKIQSLFNIFEKTLKE